MKNRPSTTRTRIRRIGIPIRLVVSLTSLLIFATVLNVNVISMPSSSPSLLIPSPATASAQMGDQDQQMNSSSSSSSSDGVFRFTYSKVGVLQPIYQRILYDSETNSLTLNNISAAINKSTDSGRFSSSQGQSQSQSNKQISDSDQKNLQQMIEQNGFFQTNRIYPPNTDRDQQNYDTLYVLSIEMGNRLHTVLWMDTSKNLPTGILPIVKTIETIASAQQYKD